MQAGVSTSIHETDLMLSVRIQSMPSTKLMFCRHGDGGPAGLSPPSQHLLRWTVVETLFQELK